MSYITSNVEYILEEWQNISQFNDSYNDTHSLICILSYSANDIMSTPFRGIVYFMYIFIFIVAIIGNGLVCAVVQTTPNMKNITNYFIANLAVGDMLMTLLCVPFTFIPMLLLRYWPFGSFMCKAVNYSQAVSVLVSAYTLVAISIDRYIIIMHPLKPRVGKMAAKVVVLAVWIGAMITALPIPIVSDLQKPTAWHEACDVYICAELWPRPEQGSQYTYALLILQFLLPLSVLICTYAQIAHTVWGGRPPGEAHDLRDSRMHNSKVKMVKMMLTVVGVFTICWSPLNIFLVLWMTHLDVDYWSRWPGTPYIWFVCHWLAMSHSCYNPIIYCYMNVRYRNGFVQILSRLLCLKKNIAVGRSSVCEGIPLSVLVGVNAAVTTGQRSLRGGKCATQSLPSSNSKCSVSCTSLRPSRGSYSIPRAVSMRSNIF